MKPQQSLLIILITLLIASMACSLGGGTSDAGEAPAVEVEEAAPDAEVMDADDSQSEDADTAEEGEDSHADDTDAAEEIGDSAAAHDYDTEFPLPDDVQNFTGSGEQVNFASEMTLEQTVDFYRRVFAEMGLTERTINTSITESTFSMVFDGHANGNALVIQGVDLGNGTTNINMRFEDV